MDLHAGPWLHRRDHPAAGETGQPERQHRECEWRRQARSVRERRSLRLRNHRRRGRFDRCSRSSESCLTPGGHVGIHVCHPADARFRIRAHRSAVWPGLAGDDRPDDYAVGCARPGGGHVCIAARALCAVAGCVRRSGGAVEQRHGRRFFDRAAGRRLRSGRPLRRGRYE